MMSDELFISSDMFFLEVILEPSGAVKNVKIHHEGKNEQQVREKISYFTLHRFILSQHFFLNRR